MFEQYKNILSSQDVKNILHISRNTVNSLLRKGEIKAFQIGRTWKIPKESLEIYINDKLNEEYNNHSKLTCPVKRIK